MLHIPKVCPFERVLSLYLDLAKKSNAEIIELGFEGFPSSQVNLTKIKTDVKAVALGYSVSQRISFMNKPEVTGLVRFLSASRKVIYEKTVVVKNVLVTDSPVVDDLVNAEDALDNPFGFPELYDSLVPYSEGLVGRKPRSPMLRPAFCWVFGARGDVDEIYGPCNRVQRALPKGQVKLVSGASIAVYEASDVFEDAHVIETTASEAVDIPTEVSNADGASDVARDLLSVVLVDTNNGSKVNWQMGQNCMMFNGTLLPPDLMLMIMRTVVYFEMVSTGTIPSLSSYGDLFDGRVVTIPLKLFSLYAAAESFNSFYHTYVEVSEPVMKLTKAFGCDGNGVFINDYTAKGMALVCGHSSQACFFFAFGVECARHFGPLTLTNTLWIMEQLASSVFFKNVNGILTGTGRSNAVVRLFGYEDGKVTARDFTRKDLPKMPSDDGFFIVGFDRPNGKRNDVCDHYVLAQCSNGVLTVVYDAYRRAPLVCGTNLYPFLDKDVAFIQLQSTVVGKGEPSSVVDDESPVIIDDGEVVVNEEVHDA